MNFNFNEAFEKMMEQAGVNTVMLFGHLNPDGDAAGSVLGLAHYIRAVYPMYTVIPYLSEKLDKGPKAEVEEDTLFVPFEAPAGQVEGLDGAYAAIACDTATRARMIGIEYFEKAKATLVIDHHAANEGYGDANYTQISEACAENLTLALDWERWRACKEETEHHPNAADYLYMGIITDTSGFTRASLNTFQAARVLLDLGADHSRAMECLHSETLDDMMKRSLLLSMTQRQFDGKVAYVIVNGEDKARYNIGYEDIHALSNVLRDCADIELGFTMYRQEEDVWRCSFRSNPKWIDVNQLVKQFGGGGHAGAAGLTMHGVDKDQFLDQLFALIGEMTTR